MSENKKIFPESRITHKYLDGLRGLEIGGSAHNPFGLDTRNVDYCDSDRTSFKREEINKCRETLRVDIVASGDDIPVASESCDFVVSSHVLEHFWDPIKALKEWHRIIVPGGYILAIIPHKERMFDRDKEPSSTTELIARHLEDKNITAEPDMSLHHSFWVTETFVEFVSKLKMDLQVVDFYDYDDKVGNGFLVVMRKMSSDEKIAGKIGKKLNRLKRYRNFKKNHQLTGMILQKIERYCQKYRRNGIVGGFKKIINSQ
jgi:SAM-dependent methyltransferase